MDRKRTAAAILVLGLTGWLISSRPAKPNPEPARQPASKLEAVGSASCSGRACHGGLGPADVRGNEYTTWITRDPHAKAYSVLTDETSRRMLVNLGKARTTRDAKPERETLCLNCHGRPAAVDTTFSCENCHGPAKGWLRPHADRDAWAKLTAAEKRRHGMWPLHSFADRARVCAECHVGSPGREVNHDLIAAGHPRLAFEFDTYLANLPRHWQTDKGRDWSAAWAIGQAASAEAALRLLAHRADPVNQLPWPEFAEYDCFACHRAIRPVGPRQPTGRAPGTVPWADWYYAMPRLLGVKGLNRDLDSLARSMSKPLPPRGEVRNEAKEAAGRLQAWLGGTPPSISLAAHVPPRVNNWDTAAQWTLGLVAEYHARPKRDPAIDRTFTDLFRQLRFPRQGKYQFDGPVDFDPAKTAELLRTAGQQVERKK